jgi:hypothetical protein
MLSSFSPKQFHTIRSPNGSFSQTGTLDTFPRVLIAGGVEINDLAIGLRAEAVFFLIHPAQRMFLHQRFTVCSSTGLPLEPLTGHENTTCGSDVGTRQQLEIAPPSPGVWPMEFAPESSPFSDAAASVRSGS